MKSHYMQGTIPKQMQGFSLIEAMVSVVIFSIGLIGLAMLQTQSLQYMQAAQDRAAVTVASNSYIDELKAATSGNKDLTVGDAVGIATTKLNALSNASRSVITVTPPNAADGRFSLNPAIRAQNLVLVFSPAVEQKIEGMDLQRAGSNQTAFARTIRFELFL